MNPYGSFVFYFFSSSLSSHFSVHKSSHQKCDHTNSDPGLYTEDQTFNLSRQFTSCKTFYNRSKPWFISFSFDFFYHNTARIIGTAKFCSFFWLKNGTTASSTAATNRRRIVFLFFALILFPPRSQKSIAFSSLFAKLSSAITTTTVRIPSITASGSCVGANIPRNFTADAVTPPCADG